jgi:hypothetical protein
MGAEQVRLFKRIEREKAEEMLDDYIQQCSEIKVPFSRSLRVFLEKQKSLQLVLSSIAQCL